MKLGSIAILAILFQVVANEYYMLSVFVMRINVSETNDQKILKNPNVSFRVILFTSSTKPKSKFPTNTDFIWKPYFLTELDISFEKLNYNFKDNFFSRLPSMFEDFSNQIKSKDTYVRFVEGNSFSININGVKYDTDNTHIFSLITDYRHMKTQKFIVNCKDGCVLIHLTNKFKFNKETDFEFEVIDNFSTFQQCEKSNEKTVFRMKSIDPTKEDKI